MLQHCSTESILKCLSYLPNKDKDSLNITELHDLVRILLFKFIYTIHYILFLLICFAFSFINLYSIEYLLIYIVYFVPTIYPDNINYILIVL